MGTDCSFDQPDGLSFNTAHMMKKRPLDAVEGPSLSPTVTPTKGNRTDSLSENTPPKVASNCTRKRLNGWTTVALRRLVSHLLDLLSGPSHCCERQS